MFDGESRRHAPPTEGMAHCPHVHEWFVKFHYEYRTIEEKYGSYQTVVKVVVPENCPLCDERWDEIIPILD